MASDKDDDKDILTIQPSAKEGGAENPDSALDADEDDDDEDDDDEGDGSGDLAVLALDVPEPEQAMAANEALAGKGKGKKPLKGKGAKEKAGIDVVIGEDMIGLEDGAEAESDADAENADISAYDSSAGDTYDSDEITDPDKSDIDPLMMILGAQEKPWENEKLSLVERMMMEPGYGRDMESVGDPVKGRDKDAQAREKAAKIGKIAAVAAGAAVLGKAAAAKQNSPNQQGKNQGPAQPGGKDQQRSGAGLAGVAKGPQRVMEQDQVAPSKADIRKEQQVAGYQPQLNTQNTHLRRMESGAAGRVDSKASSVSAPILASALDGKKAPAQSGAEFDENFMDLLENITNLDGGVSASVSVGGGGGEGLSWNPKTALDEGFAETMNMIYASLAMRDLTEISPFRVAAWDEKRLEHKENSQDVTLASPALELKEAAPDLAPERAPQINLGPGGM